MTLATVRKRLGSTLAVALLSTGYVTVAATPTQAAIPAGGMAASAVATMFNAYGDAGDHWTGADSTVSVPLPDGRVAWLFSDTFLGTVNTDGSRPRNTPMVNNTLVVQDGAELVSTRTGGTATFPEALVKPSQTGEYYWVGDGTVENGTLKVIYNRYRHTGSGSLDFALSGTALATFALPALTVSSVVDLPVGSTIGWGSAILEDGAYTYVYGTSSEHDLKFGHVARAPAGNLGGAWEYWTGTAWSGTESQAARLLSGVGTGFGVQKVGSQYVLVTQENNLVFDPQFVAYTASSPTGPFTGPVQLFTAPEQAPGNAHIVYDSRVHPELARSGKLLISYNVNSLSNDDNYTDARLYRPRFVELDWPRPAPGAVPAAPAGFAATVDTSGIATLTWQAVSGATGYRIHRRDTTAGQTHFARQPAAVTGTSTEVGQLLSGHRYEFKITAENAAGEGPFSATVAVTPTISPPPAPAGVTATADTAGRVTLTWSAVPTTWSYEVFRRDLTAGDTDYTFVNRLGATVTSTVMDSLEHNHQYEFYVTANHGGGASPPSATVTATATYAPPGTPTGLTATPKPDGTITLAWTAPGPNVYYWVYQRDVTAGETAFTRLPLPITSGTTMTAGFLIHNHEYEFKVTASNKAGESPATAPVRAQATYPPPAPPTGLTATAGNGEVKLSWTASPTSDVWYWVYQRDVTAGETAFTQLPLPVSTCCAMTAGWLTNGHTYEYKVASTGAGGDSAPTATVRATPNVPLPGQVTGLTVTSNTDGTLKVSWTSPDENVWFDVYQRDITAGETTFTKLALPITVCCTFNAGLLTNNHVYEYKVAATNSAGAGPQSAAARGTSRYSPPVAPKNLRGVSGGDGTITLDWDPPAAGGFYYWIYYRDATAGQAFIKSAYPTDKTGIDLGPYVNGHEYEFKVSADNAGGEGATSTVVRVTSRGGTPARPTNLTATAGDAQVTLRWTASTTANVLYNVYQRDATDGQSWQKLSLPVSGTTVTPGLLTNGHTYEFKVTASNASGDSGASNVVSVRPMPPLPAAPSGLTATPGDGKVTLKWTASSTSNVYYWIESRANGGNWQRSQYPVSTCCSFTVSYLANGTTYDFRLRATNLAGDSAASNTATARPMPPVPASVSLYEPAEATGKVTLTWSRSTTSNVWYWIYYRNASRGQVSWNKFAYPVPGTWAELYGMFTAGDAYEFQIAAYNVAGERRSNAELGVPRRFLPSSTPVRKRNVLNQANQYAAMWALARSQSCRPDYQQIVCFGPPPNLTGQPMTIGDYLFYEEGSTVLENRVSRETKRRATMRVLYGQGISEAKGPDLLRHEARHSEQWADHFPWAVYAVDYGSEALKSQAQTGSPACANDWEVDANLYRGGYSSYPSGGCN
jgi:fibronectin type 3 domain-containing protein